MASDRFFGLVGGGVSGILIGITLTDLVGRTVFGFLPVIVPVVLGATLYGVLGFELGSFDGKTVSLGMLLFGVGVLFAPQSIYEFKLAAILLIVFAPVFLIVTLRNIQKG